MPKNYRIWGIHFDIAGAKEKVEELEIIAGDPDFWNDTEKSHKVMKELKSYKDKIESFEALMSVYDDIYTLIEMSKEEEDEEFLIEGKQLKEDFLNEFEAIKIRTLLDGEYDSYDVYLTLHAGQGGTEACDWTSMLLRMYTKWADKRGFKIETLDYLDGEEAGVKSVTLQISGDNVYGYLKSERGVHRLVRVSPFDSSGRRHTSFASCDVMPVIEDDNEVEINPDDLRIDTYRSSGAGGQHVNKTSSAIRITHIPTGIVVQCQDERSQFSNKDRAMGMLRSKLTQLKIEENMKKLAEIRGDVKEIGWGSQIRSYVFMPYNLVKDNRTGEETANVGAVMDGDIDRFINAYLAWIHS